MKIAITIGDPAGIGPELILKTVPGRKDLGSYSIYGNKQILKKTAHDLKLKRGYASIEQHIVDVGENIDFAYGRSTKATARDALRSIQCALESGPDIVITAPVVKATIRKVAPGFIGHTEYIADFYGVRDYAMTGIWRDKRIMLLTAHLPLREVFKRIDAGMVAEKICLFAAGLQKYFGIDDPEIGVSAVNPHAYEFSLGEDEKIRDGVIGARRRGVRASGPFPGDSLFNRQFDGFIATYHDQAMVYLKSKAGGLNFTLGLPIIRLSPLCGAALDIAGKGCAEVAGFAAAFSVGKKLYANMRKYEKTV
ncbi:4-hydroxythreonine-4-phosphate dehydrogenase PdxA [candidate division WOR-3 bacterium]|nr:4-hydroxythreonine-4-phosphate dehydrogenase PdxA [candidate division WOR-3 bacterium]